MQSEFENDIKGIVYNNLEHDCLFKEDYFKKMMFFIKNDKKMDPGVCQQASIEICCSELSLLTLCLQRLKREGLDYKLILHNALIEKSRNLNWVVNIYDFSDTIKYIIKILVTSDRAYVIKAYNFILNELINLERSSDSLSLDLLLKIENKSDKIFISHSGKQKDIIMASCSDIKRSVFLDRWSHDSGLSTQDFILSGFNISNKFFCLLSNEYFESKWCVIEFKVIIMLMKYQKRSCLFVTLSEVDQILDNLRHLNLPLVQVRKILAEDLSKEMKTLLVKDRVRSKSIKSIKKK